MTVVIYTFDTGPGTAMLPTVKFDSAEAASFAAQQQKRLVAYSVDVPDALILGLLQSGTVPSQSVADYRPGGP